MLKLNYKKVTTFGCILLIIQLRRHFISYSERVQDIIPSAESKTQDEFRVNWRGDIRYSKSRFSCLWPENKTRSVRNLIQPSVVTTIVNPFQPCTMDGATKSTPFLLVIVQSAMTSFSERNVIRNTWAKAKTKNETNTKVLFLLGQGQNKPEIELQIKNEALVFNDIIQEQFLDNWTNLTVKSLMMLKWFSQNCNQTYKFLMKADEDVFVNLPLLTNILKDKIEDDVLMGNLRCDPNPAPPALKRRFIRHGVKIYPPDCVTCIPGCEYRQEIKPACLNGPAYVMDAATASRLYAASLDLQMLAYEDIFVTGILATRAGVKPTDHPGFRIKAWHRDSCPVAVEIGNNKLESLYLKYRDCKYRKVKVCKGSRIPTRYCQVICRKKQSRTNFLKPPLEMLN